MKDNEKNRNWQKRESLMDITIGHPIQAKEYYKNNDEEEYHEVKTEPMPVKNYLRDLFPNGHKDFINLTMEEMQLHSDKNHDYAAGGDALGNFKRVATILGLYDGLKLDQDIVVALVYAMKQIDAVFWTLAKNNKTKVEGIESRLQDISVYAKIAILLNREREEKKND